MGEPAFRPPGVSAINPYLAVRNVDQAVAFYERAFGFTCTRTIRDADGAAVHAELRHLDSVVMVGPQNPSGRVIAPRSGGMRSCNLYTYVACVDAIAVQANDAGGRVMQPPTDEAWGERTCLILDPDGHGWMFATRTEPLADRTAPADPVPEPVSAPTTEPGPGYVDKQVETTDASPMEPPRTDPGGP
jgi:uncharacterized glyoxalase superfamily protein PhnB